MIIYPYLSNVLGLSIVEEMRIIILLSNANCYTGQAFSLVNQIIINTMIVLMADKEILL